MIYMVTYIAINMPGMIRITDSMGFLMLPKAAQIILQTNIASKKHLAVKHLNPCFLATSVQSNYLELL